jgi:2-amino-4-hydroxy-6-hydroxymethyldihydropteridine diphosphokinase
MGNRLANLQLAVEQIQLMCGKILHSSSIYETAAWGMTDQAPFYNQALLLETTLSAKECMSLLLHIELQMGRVRNIPLGPRIIDIDILYFNDEIIDQKDLVIPHPRLAERKFVLMPLVEIAPDFIHPVFNKTNTLLLKECGDSLAVYKKTNL